jgi:hypothetical protein
MQGRGGGAELKHERGRLGITAPTGVCLSRDTGIHRPSLSRFYGTSKDREFSILHLKGIVPPQERWEEQWSGSGSGVSF